MGRERHGEGRADTRQQGATAVVSQRGGQRAVEEEMVSSRKLGRAGGRLTGGLSRSHSEKQSPIVRLLRQPRHAVREAARVDDE